MNHLIQNSKNFPSTELLMELLLLLLLWNHPRKVFLSHTSALFPTVAAPENSCCECYGALGARGVQLFKTGLTKVLLG